MILSLQLQIYFYLYIMYLFIYLLLFIFLLTDSFMPNFLNSLPSGEVFRYS